MAPPHAAHARGRRVPSIIVHGGAGAAVADADEFRPGMRAAVSAGWAVLAAGGRALDAVEAAVRSLEDDERFNAGRGAVLTEDGTVEMDASIMEGDRLGCGAVGAVSRVANPITLARRVLDDSRHVLLVAHGAHAFARAAGQPECDPASLITERQRRRLAERRAATPGNTPSRTPGGARSGTLPGTVGATALDRHGAVAAATSTGGMVGKHPGRVGDSALIGCGTYADSRLGAVSCTGAGEAIIRVVLARRALDLLQETDDAERAARLAVDLLVKDGRGDGGLILVDARGRVGFAHSTPLMPVAWMMPTLDAPR